MTRPLAQRLRDPDAAERRAACLAAAEDPAAALWIEALGALLGDPVKAVSRAAADALARIGRRERAVQDVLRDALRSPSPARRFAALHASVRLAPPQPSLLPAAVEALGSEDGDVRWAAAKILVDMGRLHGEVLGVLVGLVRGGASPVTRRMAAFALRELAPDRPEAARVLLEATHEGDVGVRRAAFTAIAALLDPPPEVVARLRHALASEPDVAARRIAAVALGELARRAEGGLDEASRAALEAAAAGGDADLRRAAERALGREARPAEAGRGRDASTGAPGARGGAA